MAVSNMVFDPVLNEPGEGMGAEHHKPPKN